jgi:subtilisin family serine protease
MPRVIAYFMHESERHAATQAMASPEATDSYVIGEVDPTRLDALRKQGLIVQELQPVTEHAAVPRRALHGVVRNLRRGMMAIAPGFGPEASPEADEIGPDMTKPQYFFLWLKGPLLESSRAELAQLNVELQEAFPTGAYKVRLEPEQVPLVSALPFVSRVELFGPQDTGPDLMTRTAGADRPPDKDLAMLCFDIRLHQPDEMQTVLDWLAQHNVAVAGSSSRKIRVYLLENAPELEAIPALSEVAGFEQYVPPKLHNDRARVLLGIDQGNPAPALGLTGAGEIVAVADTGLDDTHPDFQGRVAGIVARGRPGDSTDPHGHGTHVAGSVLGDGSASGGLLRGTAPGARLFFQSLLDADGNLGGLPLDLADLFAEAYQSGARVHNNSWGSATKSRYTINSGEVDEFVANHRDMLIVISAGNDGTAAMPRNNSAAGFVDWLSIGSPASSKNALTVGASRSDRSNGALSSLSYRDAWPNEFPDDPIGQEKVSGDPESLAGFSSRGPCDDHRIKPDLVGPGTDIASAKSALAPLRKFWGPYPGNAQYAFMGGTSMSAPLVSGCAALIREYYLTKQNHSPSAALVKATLINGTAWLKGADSVAPAPGTPNFHQGFGKVNLADSVPNPSRPNLQLRFVDDWEPAPKGFTMTGQRKRYQFTVPAGGTSLRICLAYTDLPARALQNDLNLFVQLPGGGKIMGNAQLPMSLNIPDPQNNIEIVRIDNAAVGAYLIQVAVTNLLKGPQDFALVVTGDGISPLTSV